MCTKLKYKWNVAPPRMVSYRAVSSKDSDHTLSSIIILPFREIQTKSHRVMAQQEYQEKK
jgi:hypothetical protein